MKGWSGRRIARELGGNRETVVRHLGLSKPAIPPLGSDGADTTSNPAIPAAGSHTGRRSLCEVHRTEITLAVEQGLLAQRIYQDLVTSYAFPGSYTSVNRFVHRLRSVQELPFRRWVSASEADTLNSFGAAVRAYGDEYLSGLGKNSCRRTARHGIQRCGSLPAAGLGVDCGYGRQDHLQSESMRRTSVHPRNEDSGERRS